MSIESDLAQGAEAAAKVAAYVELIDRTGSTVLDRMHDRASGPRAAAWDQGQRGTTVWCDRHERDVDECHAEASATDAVCTGVPLAHRSDPTGDGAFTPDPAAADLANAKRAAKRLRNDAELLVNIFAAYPPSRRATPYERELAGSNDPGCDSCARVETSDGDPWWVLPRLNDKQQARRSTVGGRLSEAKHLCWECEDHVRRKGCLPTTKERERRYNDVKLDKVYASFCPHKDKPAEQDVA